jgi:asparaginyl-tRNA synthetase
MIEPEVAFCDLAADMDLAEAHVKDMVRTVLAECREDIEFCNRFVDKDLIARLTMVAETPFKRLTYEDAVAILKASSHPFEYPVEYGLNLQSEHERFLTEQHFKCPVTVYNYPKEIKPFYMRLNDDDRTVAAMDLLVPGIGELIGGSQREERLDVLLASMARHSVNPEDYWWYTDLRKYGSVPHAGYGMGFERLLMFVTGVGNIRDVIPFARTPGSADF